MPIYEYRCPDCEEVYSHLWRTMKAAEENDVPVCPNCGAEHGQRVVSQVAVLGGLGGLTPNEQSQERAEDERMASFTPKAHIDKLRSGKNPKE